MKLVQPSQIAKIDAYAEKTLGIPTEELMKKSGEAVAAVVRRTAKPGSLVVILCGKGNNGGDGYAAACDLSEDYRVIAVDVFAAGQKSAAGKTFLSRFSLFGGKILLSKDEALSAIGEADVVIDAIFGTGFSGELPEELRPFACAAAEAKAPVKIAVDVPLGCDAFDGTVRKGAVRMTHTVVLSFMKYGLISYPVRDFLGEIVYSDLGLPTERIAEAFGVTDELVDDAYCVEHLPVRKSDGNKATFGHLLILAGSDAYRGAAHLVISAALRGGCGYTRFAGSQALVEELRPVYPEAIYETVPKTEDLSDGDISALVSLSKKQEVTLVGPGMGKSPRLLSLVSALLSSPGGTLVLDADALNALASFEGGALAALRGAKRPLILTPHPLEFERLSGVPVGEGSRLLIAKDFAARAGVTLVLKGAGTVVTDGERLNIASGSTTALAKAGSGDVLAGFLASLCASGADSFVAASLACYYHAEAAEALAARYSHFGVRPADLPARIAEEIARTEGERDASK